MFYNALLATVTALSLSVAAHPGHHHHRRSAAPARIVQISPDAPFSSAKFPEVQAIFEGNLRFQQTRDAASIQRLVDDGQAPPFMMISCSDSRVPESTIFDSQPGTFFMERNIANQYKPGDENAQSAMAYGIRVLGAQHVVVLGHYGCGGIAAAIATAPKEGIDVASHIVQTWIGDIRQLYLSSNRSEIVEMRNANLAVEAQGGRVPEPESPREPGFRALVEENVKQQVKRISESNVIANLHEELARLGAVGKRAEEAAPLIPVFVHGFVHDIETGEVFDLGISTGPPGFERFVGGNIGLPVVAAPTAAPVAVAPIAVVGTGLQSPESVAVAQPLVSAPSAVSAADILPHGVHAIGARANKPKARAQSVRRASRWSRRAASRS